jgi:hypothetical protein
MEIPTTTLAIFDIIAAMGLISAVAIDMRTSPQEVTAKGCRNYIAINACSPD